MYYRQRSLYQCIVPGYTESGVNMPPGFLRKFTPDGNQLLAFSVDQKNVIVYDYTGSSSGQSLYDSDTSLSDIKTRLFAQFFRLRFSIPVARGGENLNRECCLFTDDGRYVIVGSSMPHSESTDQQNPEMYDAFRHNESVSPNNRSSLEDYMLYVVNIKSGTVTDSYAFKCDRIYLSHNQGLSLCGSTLALLSVQHQTVTIFQVYSGVLIMLLSVGRFCYSDDLMVYEEGFRRGGRNRVLAEAEDEGERGGQHLSHPFHEKWYNSLKHRLLCWVLHQAETLCTPTNKMPLLNFFQKYDYLSQLRLWKMQLLDEQRLLLKYASEDIVTLKITDPTSQPAIFAIYNFETTKIQAVYENTSEEFLRIYESHTDAFRSPVSHPLAQETSSVSNDIYARALHMKFKQTITNAKYGGRVEATRRLLGQLPICSQSYSSSPYLDLSLFSYDDKWVSALERPKPCGDRPIK